MYDPLHHGPRSLFEDGKKWRAAKPTKPATYDRHPDDLRAMLTSTEQWVHDQLARYRYKPNVEWTVVPVRERGPSYPGNDWATEPVRVRFVMWVLDSRGGERVLPVTATRDVDWYFADRRDEEGFVHWLRSAIDAMENHEIDEWFRRDGALVNDPHAAPATKLIRSDIKVGEWLR